MDTRSGRPSSPPLREKVESLWPLDASNGVHISHLAGYGLRAGRSRSAAALDSHFEYPSSRSRAI